MARHPSSHLALWLRLVVLAVPLGIGSFVLAQSALGQDSPSPSATAQPTASPDSGASFTLVPPASPGPGDSGLTPLPVESDAPLPSPLASAIPVPTVISHPGDGTTNTCYDCHTSLKGKQHDVAQQWHDSVHASVQVGCADCHGGDPTSTSVTTAMSASAGFIGIPDRKTTVGICASCHSDPARMRPYSIPTDMFAQYQTSVHGLRLFTTGDTRVAICTDCHGVHEIKKASDPTSPVFPLNVPKLCSSCHSDPNLMQSYGIPTNQFDTYSQSIHGQTLLAKQDMRAPTCASCHGSHGAKPPQSTEVVEVCGKCHTATLQLYQQSKHATLADAAPKCITCHGAHDIVLPNEARFFHLDPPQYACLTCHDPVDRTLKLKSARFTLDADRRCDTCHHPDSLISAQIKSIHDSVADASTAYDSAQAAIDEAAQLGMLVTDADVQLAEAKTSLIRARATVHTTNLASIDTLAKEVVAKAAAARGIADDKIRQSEFRREAMVVVIGLIVLNVVGLYVWKRRLDRRLPRHQ